MQPWWACIYIWAYKPEKENLLKILHTIINEPHCHWLLFFPSLGLLCTNRPTTVITCGYTCGDRRRQKERKNVTEWNYLCGWGSRIQSVFRMTLNAKHRSKPTQDCIIILAIDFPLGLQRALCSLKRSINKVPAWYNSIFILLQEVASPMD